MPKRPNRYYSGPASDHFDGTHFYNPGGIVPRGGLDLLRWQFGSGKARWPRHSASPHAPAKPAGRIENGIVVTAVGHASVLIQTAGLNILVDPVWSQRMSPVGFAGPRRVNDPGIRFEDLPAVDLVLVTHNHYDHMDMATLARLVAAHDPLVVTPPGNDTIMARAVRAMRCTVIDWGETAHMGAIAVHAEPSHHWSARGTRDRRHALWAAFMIEGPAGLIYHVGDTGFHEGRNYRAIANKYGSPDLAILPIGAYEPRWFMAAQHQNPAEAVEGFRLLDARHGLGHHWGTVQLTDEAIDAPRAALEAALDASDIDRLRFQPLLPGAVHTFD